MKAADTDWKMRYSCMSEEEFSSINRNDLTKEAQEYYDHEVERRRTIEYQTKRRRDEEKTRRELEKQFLADEDYFLKMRKVYRRWLN